MEAFPTIFELAAVPLPGREFHGREVVPVRGEPWVRHVLGERKGLHEDEGVSVTGWEKRYKVGGVEGAV
jgi:arylsulfatase